MNDGSNGTCSIPNDVYLSHPNLYVKETIPVLVEWAKTQPAMVHMLEIEYYLLFFARVDMRNDETYDIHLRRESGTIIERPTSIRATAALGFRWLQEEVTHFPRNYTWDEFKTLHKSITTNINKAIANHHGVVCTTISNNQIVMN